MTLSPEERKAIVDYRIERAHLTLKEVEYVVKGKFWNLAANRLYYTLFYICEALLLNNKITTTTHAGVIRMINLHFVRTGKISKEDASLLGDIFRMRQTGDYDDLTDWKEDQILPVIPKVKSLVDHIENLIKNNIC